MPAITLPVAGAAEFARIVKALSASAAHKEQWADERVKSVLLRRTSPDVLTLTGTDRYVAVESAVKVGDPVYLDAVPPEGLLVIAADLAKVLAVTATEIRSGDSIDVVIEFSGNTATLSRDGKNAAAVPGTEFHLDVPSLFENTPAAGPLVAPVIAPERMATIAGMLPETTVFMPWLENATTGSHPRVMWRWQSEDVRSRLIVMCMARPTESEGS